jgi:hypothetical protein
VGVGELDRPGVSAASGHHRAHRLLRLHGTNVYPATRAGWGKGSFSGNVGIFRQPLACAFPAALTGSRQLAVRERAFA